MKHTRSAPGTRVRHYQFAPYLEEHGFDLTWLPLFDDAYLARLYKSPLFGEDYLRRLLHDRSRIAAIARSYAGQVKRVLRPPPHDVVWLQYELLPWVPAPIEQLLGSRLAPVVVDYDDAIFFKYERYGFGMMRSALRKKIDAVMQSAAIVVAGNEFLRDRAVRAGARHVEIIPSVVDTRCYVRAAHGPRDVVTVGWIGSPTTARYLQNLGGPLARLQQEHGIRIRLVGSGSVSLAPARPEIVGWSEETQAADLAGFDIGVMPLTDTPWERGKCGYKLIQYMASGLPVVASPVGANRQIVEHGRSGFLAETADDWHRALERLILDPELRASMGARGFELAATRYSLDVAAPRLADLLRSVVEESGSRRGSGQ